MERKYDLICQEYAAGSTIRDLVAKHNVPRTTLTRKIKECGLSLRSWTRTPFDINQLTTICDEQSAYWLGFIYAEGNLYKTELAIKLGMKDFAHLEKLCRWLNLNKGPTLVKAYKPSNTAVSCRIRLRDKSLPAELKKVGIVPAKSDKLRFPTFIADDLMRHFVRGFIDGDGWICDSEDAWRLGCHSTSKRFIHDLRNWFCPGHGSIVVRKWKNPKHKTGYQLVFGGNRLVPPLLDALYSDATIYMDRKMKLARTCLKELNIHAEGRTGEIPPFRVH